MLRTFVLICLTIAAGLAAAEGIVAAPVDGYVPRPRLAQSEPQPSPAPVVRSPDALWLQFDRMDPAERQNAALSLQPSSEALPGAWDECREICRLWNSGAHDAAIERLRNYSRFDDPCQVTVAVSWRKPVETPQDGSWGPDTRIGARDNLYDLMMDRAATGYLFAATPRRESSMTRIIIYRSTNNGSSWAEMSWVSWGGTNYLTAWSAACHGNYYQVSWATRDANHYRAWSARNRMSSGDWVLFPGDSLAVIAINGTSGDTIRELAVCTQEDIFPGWRVYLFGRTDHSKLYFSWTDSSCRAWRPHSTGVTSCDNGLDCTFNEGGDARLVWTSWLRYWSADSDAVVLGYLTTADTLFHSVNFNNVYGRRLDFEPTSITAWRDTVSIAYTTVDGLVRMVYTNTAGESTWHTRTLSHDTLYIQELPEVSAREVGGLATAYRSYASGADRWVYARRADRANGTLTTADTVNEAAHRPYPLARIRIVPLDGGSYGVGWINWTDPIHYGAWFNTYTPTGIAELPPAPPVPLSFRAVPRKGGASLSFENPAPGPVRLRVFDRAGRLAWSRKLVLPPGRQAVRFDSPVSGVYVAVLEAGGRFVTVKFATVE